MSRVASIVAGLLAGVVLSGCSTSMSGLLGGDEPVQQQVSAQAAPDLSMPPDLQLPAPGTQAPPPPVRSTQVASLQEPDYAEPSVSQAPSSPAPAPAPQGDIYERNGISKVNADGTPKTDAELKAELKQKYLTQKQQANPNYGTVFNIGNIFKDE